MDREQRQRAFRIDTTLGMVLLWAGPVLIAIVLSNLPEGLSSSAGMKHAGRTAGFVFGVWTAIAVASGVAGLLGYALLVDASPETVAVITAVAAGAILAMVADTMIPEAFERTGLYNGALCVLGFVVSFTVSRGLGN